MNANEIAATLSSAGNMVELPNLPLKPASRVDSYRPKFFNQAQFHTLEALCEDIIPSDSESGGAVEAGVAPFIDTAASANQSMQVQLSGGLAWLDAFCRREFHKRYIQCSPVERRALLNLLAYKRNVAVRPELSHGVEFFSLLRRLTLDAFFTSEIGIKYVSYIGNFPLETFPGCPVPEL